MKTAFVTGASGVLGTAIAQALLGRFGEPKEVASPVAFLASSEASYIIGQVIC